MKIDIHAHILPRDIPDWQAAFGYGDFIQLEHHKPGWARMMKGGEFFREVYANTWDPQLRLAEMDEKGVQMQALSTVPVMFNYWTPARDGAQIARYLNDDLAATCAAHPTRFVGLATLPMQDTDLAIKELERCVHQLQLPGIQIGTHVNGRNLEEPEFFPVFEAAQALGAAVFIHPWDMLARERMTKYWLPWLVGMPAESALAICCLIFGGVFERLPHLRVCIAHGGGAFPGTIGRIEHGYRVRPDLVAVDNPHNPRKYLGRFWLDTLVHDPRLLQYLAELVGPERIVLGTDYPFPLGEWLDGQWLPGELVDSTPAFTDLQREAMRSRNALDWLGIPDPTA